MSLQNVNFVTKKLDNTVTCHLGTHSENSAKVRTEQAERT